MAERFLRTFVAVEINAAVRAALERVQKRLAYVQAHVGWVAPKNIHCTLLFLGDVGESKVPVLANALQAAAGGFMPFDMQISGLGFFGSPRAPRIVWAGVAPPGNAVLAELQRAVVVAAGKALGADLATTEKPFHPHLTIGRVRSNRNVGELVHTLQEYGATAFGSVAVAQIVLMESRLAPQGPTYLPLAAASLTAPVN